MEGFLETGMCPPDEIFKPAHRICNLLGKATSLLGATLERELFRPWEPQRLRRHLTEAWNLCKHPSINAIRFRVLAQIRAQCLHLLSRNPPDLASSPCKILSDRKPAHAGWFEQNANAVFAAAPFLTDRLPERCQSIACVRKPLPLLRDCTVKAAYGSNMLSANPKIDADDDFGQVITPFDGHDELRCSHQRR